MRRPPGECGDQVFDYLMSVNSASKAKISAATGLTGGQVQTGLDHVRDVLAGESYQPLVYDPSSREYSFATLASKTEAYRQYRAKIMAKQLRRLRTGTSAPAATKFGSRELEWIDIQLSRVQEDLERLANGAAR